MNAYEIKATRATKKMSVVLFLLLAFMMLSNFVTWKANVTRPGNLQNSVIGSAIQQGLAQTDIQKGGSLLSLDKDDVAGRIVIPEKMQPYLTLPFASDSVATGNIDEVIKIDSGWTLGGWTYVPESAGSPEFVVAVENEKVVGVLPVNVLRPDVAKALNTPKASRTGYSGKIISPLDAASCKLKLYTLTSSLKLFAMPSICDKANHSAP
ncbi:hypothetical protein [Pseudomonas sp. O11]|uniref:hypothetical protein n=1 Tax=Pseudomonas sp. O11 TaxID=3159446 RepID=UPI00387ADC9A